MRIASRILQSLHVPRARVSLVARALALLCVCGVLRAQEGDAAALTREDSVIHRARQLVLEGDASAGRRVIDSLVKAHTPDSAVYAEALYWRAALAGEAADAERDYRRLLVEAPLSARAEDGLLQLAQLQQARGDRAGAAERLSRFMLLYGNSPERARVALSLVRLRFELGQSDRGCEALRMGREAIPAENVEMRNQLDFYAPRCAVAEVAPAAAPSPPAAAGPLASTAGELASYYSVQVAAYDSRQPAAQMAQSLVSRGLEARVDGTSAPFRVRVGKYALRAEAVKAAAALKADGLSGFVTLVQGGR